MSGLVEFLRARLDEEVAYFIAAKEPGWNEWDEGDPIDPDFRLAEVDAKRRIIDLHRPVRFEDEDMNDIGGGCSECGFDARYESGGCETLRLLALPHADHPAYDESWKP